MLAVNPKSNLDSVPQLIAYAKANPDKLNFASAGSGTTPHLAGELFKSMAGIKLVHVPYKGAGPAFTALLGGEVDMMFVDVFIALPHVKSGRLHALALGGGQRNPLLPNVPVMAEFVPGFDYEVWQGMVAPAGTPAAIRTKLAQAVAEAVQQPEMRKKLADIGLEAVGSTPTDMGKVMRTDRERWGQVIRATGARAD